MQAIPCAWLPKVTKFTPPNWAVVLSTIAILLLTFTYCNCSLIYNHAGGSTWIQIYLWKGSSLCNNQRNTHLTLKSSSPGLAASPVSSPSWCTFLTSLKSSITYTANMVPHCNRSWPGSTVLCGQSTPTSRRTVTGPFSGLTSQGSSSPSLLSLLASTSKGKCDPANQAGSGLRIEHRLAHQRCSVVRLSH